MNRKVTPGRSSACWSNCIAAQTGPADRRSRTKISRRINIGVEERTGKRESGVLRCRGTDRKSIFRRVPKSGPHGKVEKTPRPEPCASRVDVNRELNILDERAAGFETP